MLKRVAAMKASGRAIHDAARPLRRGLPRLRPRTAAALAALGVPAFACTPDLFPEVMAAAIEKRPLPIPDTAAGHRAEEAPVRDVPLVRSPAPPDCGSNRSNRSKGPIPLPRGPHPLRGRCRRLTSVTVITAQM